FEFPLLGRFVGGTSLRQKLDAAALERKLTSCRAYDKPIVEVARRMAGDDGALSEERMRLAWPWAIQSRRDVLYSRPGEGRICAVHFRDPILPIAGAVHQFVSGCPAWAA